MELQKLGLLYLGEVGGYMGLLIGMSVLTLFEMLDFIIYNTLSNLWQKRKKANTESDGSALEQSTPQTVEVAQ